MAASRIAPALTIAAICGLPVAQAAAQTTISDEPALVYQGMTFDLDVEVRVPGPAVFDAVEVTLPSHFEVRRVDALNSIGAYLGTLISDQPSDPDSPVRLGCSYFNGVYSGCNSQPHPAPLDVLTVFLEEVSAPTRMQKIRVTRNPGAAVWSVTLRITVVVRGGYDCVSDSDPIVARFLGSGPPRLQAAACAMTAALTAGVVLDLQPSSPVHRTAAAQVLAGGWRVRTDQGDFPIMDRIPSFGCVDPAQCTDSDPAQRVRLLPAVNCGASHLCVEVLNRPADPSPGATGIAFQADFQGTVYPSLTSLVIDEAPASLAVDQVGTQIEPPAMTPATFTVTAAANSDGGVEPQLAAWDLTIVTADLPPAVPVPGGLDPNAWMDVAAGVEARAMTVTVPAADVTFLQGETMHLLVTATGRLGAPPQTFDLYVGSEPPKPQLPVCSIHIVAGRPRLGFKQDAVLELRAAGKVVTEPVTWTLAPQSGGSLTPDASIPGRATYRAPFADADVTVTADFPGRTVCDNESATVDIEVRGGKLGVTLSAERTTVQPGRMVVLTASVTSSLGVAVKDLYFNLDHPASLQPLRGSPAGGAGVVDFRSLPAGSSALSFVGDVGRDGSSVGHRIAMLARPGAGCMTAHVTLRVYRDAAAFAAGDAWLGESDPVSVRILCDPETLEATLFGKVFADRDGDGLQGPEERGIGGAMVAVASGIYAVTDADGRYHIPRLQPGRHAVRVNEATLPTGARVRGQSTRTTTLTPGMFTRINFPVQLLSLRDMEDLTLAPAGSGVAIVDGAVVYRARLRAGKGATLLARRGDLEIGAQRDGDDLLLLLPLDVSATEWLLLLGDAQGRGAIYSFGVHSYERDGGTLVVPWGPRLVARLALPPPQGVSRGGGFRLDALVYTNGGVGAATSPAGPGAKEPCAVGLESPRPEGETWRCALAVDDATENLSLAVDPWPDAAGVDPPSQTVTLPLRVNPSEHFLVGIGGGAFGCDPRRGNFGADDCWGDGGGSFYYRGRVGGLGLVAGADAHLRDALGQARRRWVFTRDGDRGPKGAIDPWKVGHYLLSHDKRRIFRDLDPESYYPTYGDGAKVVDERESGGRFFFRLHAGRDSLRWGGMQTAIGTGTDAVEVGRYVRSLYGLSGQLRLGDAHDPDLPLALNIIGFGAQPETAAASDELTVTGGSLYFLGHRDLVEGSVRVTLEILDEVSGLPVRRVRLNEDIDFEVDAVGGRLTLQPALVYRAFGQSLTAVGSGGPAARLIVEYEYVPGSNVTDNLALGARTVGTFGPIAVGATFVTELDGRRSGPDPATYRLLGASVRLDLGDTIDLKLDFAHSSGGSHQMTRSRDGGLSQEPADFPAAAPGATVSPVTPPAGDPLPEGNAVAVEVGTGFGDAGSGDTGRAYARWYEADFADSRHAPGARAIQGGVSVATRFSTGTTVRGQLDHQQLQPEGGDNRLRTTGLLHVSQTLGDFEVAAEGRYVGDQVGAGTASHRFLLGGLVGYRLLPNLVLSLRRLQRVIGAAASPSSGDIPGGETAIGGSYKDAERWSIGGEVGLDDAASPFGRVRVGLPVDATTELYVGFLSTSRLDAGLTSLQRPPSSRLVTGGRRRAARGVSLYAESSIDERAAGDGESQTATTRSVGAEVGVIENLSLTCNYQRGSLVRVLGDGTGNIVRDAGSIGAVYAGQRLNLRFSFDGRIDQDRQWQVGAQGRGEARVAPWLTLALALRGGSAFAVGSSLGSPVRSAWEGSVGFALRPVDADFVNAFGRYALIHERDRRGDQDAAEQLTHIAALALVVEVVQPFALATKIAYRRTDVQMINRQVGDPLHVDDDALIGALRGDLHLNATWDAAAEARVCTSPAAGGAPRFGALAELTMRILGWLQMGVGYNFSEISAAAVVCNEPGAKGFFVRAEAVY